jgi:hypothetical protein
MNQHDESPIRPADDPRLREAAARKALVTYERQRERAFRRNLALAALLAVPPAFAILWLLGVGYQRHVLELRLGDAKVRLVSHRGPYELLVPGRLEPDFQAGGAGKILRSRIEGKSIEPVSLDWASYATSEQTVTLDPDRGNPDFIINGLYFTLVGAELIYEDRRWLIKRGGRIEINVDRLPRALVPMPPPPSRPVEDEDP